ncbi:hypothetical protein SBRV1_gp16 [Sulfolobales Beppu rod-shaped virus 1]|uniref:Uncharacterized protein n=1 Tax=Sulfolobales Beppu rod-shaped virus 1 TaxID=2493121 RepID=A0A3Q8Q3Z2_9VIRU|nr:hypothetical protein QIT32_gp16 [Sulfolobales Beppu rod-shaped virus 1]AZI75905.1 hypothetical protein SBRV1_gp16 [Sulfolobales Beppu rod-shaped virus 1]
MLQQNNEMRYLCEQFFIQSINWVKMRYDDIIIFYRIEEFEDRLTLQIDSHIYQHNNEEEFMQIYKYLTKTFLMKSAIHGRISIRYKKVKIIVDCYFRNESIPP